MKSYLVTVEDKRQEVVPENGKHFKLNELYRLLDCTSIQIVQSINEGELLVIDEEGKLKPNARTNVKATLLYAHGAQDPVVGKALVCPAEMIE